MICPGSAIIAKHFSHQAAKAAAHPVADNRITDFFGDGDAKPDVSFIVIPVMHQQNKTGRSKSLPPVCAEKISAFFYHGVRRQDIRLRLALLLKQRASCGHGCGVHSKWHGLRLLPYGGENHGGVNARGCLAERCASLR
jgi:hypothetical protein